MTAGKIKPEDFSLEGQFEGWVIDQNRHLIPPSVALQLCPEALELGEVPGPQPQQQQQATAEVAAAAPAASSAAAAAAPTSSSAAERSPRRAEPTAEVSDPAEGKKRLGRKSASRRSVSWHQDSAWIWRPAKAHSSSSLPEIPLPRNLRVAFDLHGTLDDGTNEGNIPRATVESLAKLLKFCKDCGIELQIWVCSYIGRSLVALARRSGSRIAPQRAAKQGRGRSAGSESSSASSKYQRR